MKQCTGQGQTRIQSAIEQVLNVGSGFIVSLAFLTWIVVPVWHLQVNRVENIQITAAFTVLSVVRGYVWRRIFNRIRK